MEKADFEVEQYRALRAEIIRSMEDGNQIMAFGLTAIGLIVNAGFVAKHSLVGFIVFSSLLPILGALVLSLWFAAQERTARASYFLTGVEVRIKNAARMHSNSPSWEAWLRNPDANGQGNHFWSTERTAIALFLMIIICSIAFSFAVGSSVSVLLEVGIVAVSTIAILPILWNLRRRFRRWRDWLSSHYDPAMNNSSSSSPGTV